MALLTNIILAVDIQRMISMNSIESTFKCSMPEKREDQTTMKIFTLPIIMCDTQSVKMGAGAGTVPRHVATVSLGILVTKLMVLVMEGVYLGGCHPHVKHVSILISCTDRHTVLFKIYDVLLCLRSWLGAINAFYRM